MIKSKLKMKKNPKIIALLLLMMVTLFIAGCKKEKNRQNENKNRQLTDTIINESKLNNQQKSNSQQGLNRQQESNNQQRTEEKNGELAEIVTPDTKIIKLEDKFSAVKYEEDYGFDIYLEQGGASSDSEVMDFLIKNLLPEMQNVKIQENIFGCSTLSVKNSENEFIFGRNFDWNSCEALVVMSYPEHDYASISTVNMDFIYSKTNSPLTILPDKARILAALYAPLDGMNEKGLCVSVNMIQDMENINQNTDKPDITTTTAIRLMLNKAANVDEALALLEQYDVHASMGMMIHFALADSNGKSVVVEYIENEMVVTDTPVVTNFYLASGKKQGIGTKQSHTRYNLLMEQLSKTPIMSMEDVREALERVSKKNFGEFESTEWSIVYNQNSGEIRYYHQENYEKSYIFYMK